MATRKRPSVCSVAGCPTLTTEGRCGEHRRAADQRRGSAAERGYTSAQYRRSRRIVLRRDPVCVLCALEPSTVSDHWPLSRRELVERGVADPDAPHRLRALCASCHGKQTAREQPGGWNRRG